MDWCEDNGLDYVFRAARQQILAAAVEDKADDSVPLKTADATRRADVSSGQQRQRLPCLVHGLW